MEELQSRVFSRVRSAEEPFNDQLGALLGYSLERGSALIEVLHSDLELKDETQLLALQAQSRLDDTINGGSWEIDLAFRDHQTILGIESKRADDLTKTQLQKELQVLKQNADDREVILLCITEDYQEPGIVQNINNETEHTVLWNSWHRIGRRIETKDFPTGYGPIRAMVTSLFDDADYTQRFEGFPEPALDSTVYIEWLQQLCNLALDIDTLLHDKPLNLNRGGRVNLPSFADKSTGTFEDTYYQPAATAIVIPFTLDPDRSLNNWHNSSHVSLYANYHDDEIGVFLDLNPKNDGWSKPLLRNNSAEIAETVDKNDMFVRASRNSHCNTKRTPEDLKKRAEIRACLEEKAGTDEVKRVMIGRFVPEANTPQQTVETFASEIASCYETFFEDGEMLGQYQA